MKTLGAILGLMLGLLGAARASAPDLGKLNVLYLGDAGSERARQFESFLRQKVGQVAIAPRRSFKAADAEHFDVVLLDWPQPAEQEWKTGHSPLGERTHWHKPTVLLGSAGLNLAVVWKVRGGSG